MVFLRKNKVLEGFREDRRKAKIAKSLFFLRKIKVFDKIFRD